MRNVLQISLRAWEESGRRPNFLLPPGKSLQGALELLASDPEHVGGSLRTFIELSAANAKRRQRRRLLWLSCLAIPILLYGGFVYYWSLIPGAPKGAGVRVTEELRTARLSPDASRIATITVDNKARLWNADTSEPVSETLYHPQACLLDFNPGSTLLLTAGRDGTARLWDSSNGSSILKPLDHKDVITVAMFSPDGNAILTGGENKTVILWNPSNGQPKAAPLQHTASIRSAAYSLDGRKFVTTAADNTIRVWNAETGTPLGKLMESDQELSSAAFNGDTTRVITVSTLGTATIWDITTGQPVQKLEKSLCVALNADATRLVAGDPQGAQIYDATTGKPVGPRLKHDGAVTVVAYSPRGDLVFTASQQSTAYTWKVPSGEIFGRFNLPKHTLLSAGFSPDGRRILTSFAKRSEQGPANQPASPVSIQQPTQAQLEGLALLWLPNGSTLGRPMRSSVNIERCPALFSTDGNTLITIADKEVVLRNAGADHVPK